MLSTNKKHLTLVLAALAACKPVTKEADTSLQDAAVPAHVEVSPSAASPRVSPSLVETPPSVPSFYLAAKNRYPFVLASLGNTGVFYTSRVLGTIENQKPVVRPENTRGVEDAWSDSQSLIGIQGVWPSHAHMAFVDHAARVGGWSKLFRRTPETWKLLKETRPNHGEIPRIVAISSWSSGRLLSLERAREWDRDRDRSSISVYDGSLEGAPKLKTPKTPSGCRHATVVVASLMAALPTGEVMTVGESCDESLSREFMAVERWEAGKQDSQVDRLPLPAGMEYLDIKQILLVSPKDAIVVGAARKWIRKTKRGDDYLVKPYIARFDGTSWVMQTAPEFEGRTIFSAALDSRGRLWAVTGTHRVDHEWPHDWNETADSTAQQPKHRRVAVAVASDVFRQEASGDWAAEKLPLPPPDRFAHGEYAPNQIIFADGKPWIAAAYRTYDSAYRSYDGSEQLGTASVLLGPSPLDSVVSIPEYETVAKVLYPFRPATGWRRGYCDEPFALLYEVSGVAPPNFDFPATRAVLKGHPEFGEAIFLDFRQGTKRYFGAKVTDEKMGRALVKLVKEGVPGSAPQFACHNPSGARIVPINLLTGEIRKG